MTSSNPQELQQLIRDIAISLGYEGGRPPLQVDDKQAATALGIKAGTLAVWRSTGRYDLPFAKIGRLVRYRLADLAKFIDSRTAGHTA